MRKVLEICLAVALLCSGAFAAFIQSPIPPSSKQNYFRDTDGDGRMDRIVVRFLGAITQDYIDQKIDSLTYTWVDSTGLVSRFTALPADMRLDTTNTRQMLVGVNQKKFERLTTTSSAFMPVGSYGKVNLYLTDSTVFHVVMRDGMSPAIRDAHLKSYRGTRTDTLQVNFTEWAEAVEGCDAMLEFKKTGDSTVRYLPASAVEWSPLASKALFMFDRELTLNVRLSPGDSLRLTSGCIKDTASNAVLQNGKFVEVDGFYPFLLNVTELVEDDETSATDDQPIFELDFLSEEEEQNEGFHKWRMTMEILGQSFEDAIRDAERMEANDPIELSKLKITYSVRIYTNLGAYVVGTSYDIKGSDSRFEHKPTFLSLRWNLMDMHHRRVSTGAYIANIFAAVEYGGKVIYRSDMQPDNLSRVFGVKRR